MADSSANGSNGVDAGPLPVSRHSGHRRGRQGSGLHEAYITQGGCGLSHHLVHHHGRGLSRNISNGHKNVWGEELAFVEPESEHSSASACEGFAVAGGRVTNFTSGQGLVLMKEVLYTISGSACRSSSTSAPCALTSQSLNVHAGHDDVMASRLRLGHALRQERPGRRRPALISRRAAEDTETPFMNIQDGFLTTHTVENLLKPEPEMMKEFIGHPSAKLRNFMDPSNPVMSGVVQNQDAYMKGKIAHGHFYDKIPQAVRNAMSEFYKLTGRRYDLVERYRMDDAEYAVVGLGGMMETAMAAVDWIRQKAGIKVGVLHVTCDRPFPAAKVLDALKSVKRGASWNAWTTRWRRTIR